MANPVLTTPPLGSIANATEIFYGATVMLCVVIKSAGAAGKV